MYSRPTRVQVGPHEYEIKWGTVREMGESEGDVDSDTLEIWVQKYGRKSKRVEILIHEIVHSILDQAQAIELIKGDRTSEEIKEVEEALVSILGVGLTDWIRQNPLIIHYILQELEHKT